MTSMLNDMKDELNAALRSVMSIQSSQVPVESSYFDTDPYVSRLENIFVSEAQYAVYRNI